MQTTHIAVIRVTTGLERKGVAIPVGWRERPREWARIYADVCPENTVAFIPVQDVDLLITTLSR